MLRSKFHRPWQPHVSDSQPFNPSAHTTESATSFSEQIEELEEQGQTPAESQNAAAAASSGAVEDVKSSSSVAPETPRGRSRWYANLVDRFSRH